MTDNDPKSYAFDLASAIPYFALPPTKRTLYWDDGVHLTPSAYEWMGGHVADALIKIMIEEATTAAAAAGTGAGGAARDAACQEDAAVRQGRAAI
ncbi:conserved hypothetical protein [Verticillium alfalfae VaMs.102]|uniref:SGNH hydrolase-type esterase domain-containing protein n=1 Tax=Verticillium alfalfae (strain VaMs.102 / ATCC MYA-4576 / FGSC 10136) TaxID=526221 RepID=C9SIC6_VERA1|nr:conserved hypothetical protein [Verticillium alfalfae VaMs.102]EEY18699.1 conserved hypothetical protein [Verticillium alfalfae VaMs.102]